MKKVILLLATLNICVFIVSYTACHKKTDACASITCQNGGTCSGGTCTCPTGYSGADCSICNIGCSPSCVNGTCECGSCGCNPGYTGATCNHAWIHNLVGTWHQTDSCASTGAFGGVGTSTVDSIDPTHFRINNLDNTGANVICGMTSPTAFKVDSFVNTSGYYIWWVYDPKVNSKLSKLTGTYAKAKSGLYRIYLYALVRYYTQASPDTCLVELY